MSQIGYITDPEYLLGGPSSSPDFTRVHCTPSATTHLDSLVANITMDTDIDPTGELEGGTNGFLQETGAFNEARDFCGVQA